jgi:ribosomal protein L12E/L44/L45/RPP1/RPP2
MNARTMLSLCMVLGVFGVAAVSDAPSKANVTQPAGVFAKDEKKDTRRPPEKKEKKKGEESEEELRDTATQLS